MTPAPPADLPQTLGGFLDHAAAAFGPRQAIASTRGPFTYAGLALAADRIAAGLVASGVRKGVRVGILLPNWPEWLTTAFGVAKAGGLVVGLNTLSRPAELAYQIRSAEVAWVIAARRFLKNDYGAVLAEIAGPVLRGGVAPAVPELRKVVFLEDERPAGSHAFADLVSAGARVTDAERQAVQASVLPSDDAVVFFTSGSTATPKAAVLSHRALTHNARALGDHLGIEPDDRTWTTLPLFFSGGFCLCALSTLSRGGCVVLNEVFEAGAALERLERERCTVMVGWNHVPLMLEHADFPRRRLALRKGVGGNLELADRFLRPDHVAVGCYGMTETSTSCVSAHWTDPPEVRRTFGRPMPGVELRIVDPEDGRAEPRGEEGEIWVRSPAQMSRYLGRAPEECFTPEGFFRTGDMGFLDDRGCLHFSQRLKDVIKTMGVNVAAPEVEAALESHPAVKRALVVGVPHPVRGENVAAFVVAEGAAPAAEELLSFLSERLASYKLPRHLFFLAEEEIPISASSKVEKRRLRERAVASLRAAEDEERR